jgi:hypothetical protein
MNSIREDDANVPDVTAPVLVNVIDIDPPSAHGKVVVRDSPSGETVIAVFIAAWLTVAATMRCVVEVAGPERVEGANGEGADGLCPPQPTRRLREMRNAPEGHARIGGILSERAGLSRCQRSILTWTGFDPSFSNHRTPSATRSNPSKHGRRSGTGTVTVI